LGASRLLIKPVLVSPVNSGRGGHAVGTC
jgi:hypothetical protein